MTGNPKNHARTVAEFQRKRIVDLAGIAQEKRQELTRLEALSSAFRTQGQYEFPELARELGEARVEVDQAQLKVRLAMEEMRKIAEARR